MKNIVFIEDLAIFGAKPLFQKPRSTSNLYAPNFQKFLEYSEIFFEKKRYTNNGPVLEILEKKLAEFHGSSFCIATCSGFWALVLAIRSLAINGKNEVILPSFTYRRMDDVVNWAGLKPVYCDVNPDTLTINKELLVEKITERTGLILAVHPIINCLPVTEIELLATSHNIPLIFDSVESQNEWYNGKKIGSFGDAECFSLHASKFLNGFEGGYITCNDADLASRLAYLRGFGIFGADNIVEIGTNAKMNEIHAAMALASLNEVELQIKKNKSRYKKYCQLLDKDPGFKIRLFDESQRPGYKNIVVEIIGDWLLSRDQIIDILNKELIYARAYYPHPLHKKKLVNTFLPNTEYLADKLLILPSGAQVTINDIKYIVKILKYIFLHNVNIAKRINAT